MTPHWYNGIIINKCEKYSLVNSVNPYILNMNMAKMPTC